MVLRPKLFKTSKPSKAKTKAALAKTKIKTSKKGFTTGLKTKIGLKDYITSSNTKYNFMKILCRCVHIG